MRKSNIRKKTFLLPQDLINETKKTFGAKTETEAVISAMEEITFKKELLEWHGRNAGRLKIRDVYGRSLSPKERD